MKKFSLNVLITSLCLLACNSRTDLKVDKDYAELKTCAYCLYRNYHLIFNACDSMPSKEVYNKDMITGNTFCNNEISKSAGRLVATATIYKDSTIFFYYELNKSIPSKQTIIIYSNSDRKVESKITSDFKLVRMLDKEGYQFERIISIGN